MQYANADSTYCEWVGQAANIIAENRNNGMSEFDLMENYLDQNQSYEEQKVVIPLIERIYSTDRGIGPEEIAIVEQQHVTRTLTNAIRLGRVAHAYLFAGTR